MKKKIESYQGAAGGWGAVKSVANAVRKQMDIRQDVIAMFDMNKPEGFDCPGCAWPDPKHSASFDICENGAKAIAWEVTDKQVNASFFAENTVQSLLTWELAHAFKAIVIPIRLNSILRAALPMKLPFFISFLPVNTGAITFPTAPTCAMNRQAWVWQRVSV